MGRGTIGELAYELLARGLSFSTPVAVVSDVSRPTEMQTWTNLGMLNEHVSQDSKAPPTLFVIGAAVAPAFMQLASSPIVAAG
jgi:siroheme synthase